MSSHDEHWIQKAEQVAAEVLAKHADDVDETGRWPQESVDALGESGFFGLTVPPEFGGAGQGPRIFSHVAQNMSAHCASTAMIYLMHICGTQVIAQAAKLDDKDTILRSIAGGNHLTTLAFSEKGSRSHFWAPLSRASANGKMHTLSAEKSWVTSAGYADSYIVSTRPAGSDEPMASSLYYVSKDNPGIEVSGPWNGLGLRGNASAPMTLNKAAVSPGKLVSGDGEGFQCMLSVVLPWFQLGNASVSVGIARAAAEATKKHLLASKLEHLGQSLADLMNLRARLAQMQIITDTQQAFLDYVAARMQNPGPDTMLAVLESKAAAAEASLQVTDLAMRTCGGASFSRHLTVERNFRDARAGYVMAPTTDVLYDFIGKSLLDMPLF